MTQEGVRYAIFRRADSDIVFWQWLSGGGENKETPLEAARREAFEEGGISPECNFIALDSKFTIPVVGICGYLKWGPRVLVVPEHCFGVRIDDHRIKLSREHSEFRWVDYDTAWELLRFDSNRNALWELNHRLTRRAK